MSINRTDFVFYVSTLASVGSMFVKLAGGSGAVSGSVLTWVSIVSSLAAFAAYEFYEFFNGNTPPPAPPLA